MTNKAQCLSHLTNQRVARAQASTGIRSEQVLLKLKGIRGHSIGEYSAKKYFFSSGQNNCYKVSPYFSLTEVEKCPNFTKFELFWGKITKNCTLFLEGGG